MPENTGITSGTVLEGYRIERHLGHGGMGELYEATQLSLDRRVAFKIIARELSSSHPFRERFQREARSAASLEHPNILPVYETGEIPDGRLFMTIRLVNGPDLGKYLASSGSLEPAQAVDILGQVADALDAAHDAGLIHRDVKPSNVLLEQGRDAMRAYLSDFGLAKKVDDSTEHTETGQLLGTVDYMAPEQIEGGTLDGRVDVYAFGCLVYRCITGDVPYKRDSRGATLLAHANAAVPTPSERVPELPEAFDTVVQRAMEKDRDKRARSAGSLMHWAASQLTSPQSAEPEDESLVEPTASTTAIEIDAGKGLCAVRGIVLHVVIYAPVWAGAYLIGRSI